MTAWAPGEHSPPARLAPGHPHHTPGQARPGRQVPAPTSCSEAISLRNFLMKSARLWMVRVRSTAHFLVFMMGVSATALSRMSTAGQGQALTPLAADAPPPLPHWSDPLPLPPPTGQGTCPSPHKPARSPTPTVASRPITFLFRVAGGVLGARGAGRRRDRVNSPRCSCSSGFRGFLPALAPALDLRRGGRLLLRFRHCWSPSGGSDAR